MSEKEDPRTLEADLVVLATGVEPADDLKRALKQASLDGVEVFAIGDCTLPRGFAEALKDARAVGCQL